MAEDRLHFQIITMAGVLYDRMVSMVDVPLSDGFIGIMAGNQPLLGSVVDGPVKCVYEGGKDYFYVGTGVLDVNNDNVSLLVRVAERAETIDTIRTVGALERAQAVLRKDLTTAERKEAMADLQRARARLKAHDVFQNQSDII